MVLNNVEISPQRSLFHEWVLCRILKNEQKQSVSVVSQKKNFLLKKILFSIIAETPEFPEPPNDFPEAFDPKNHSASKKDDNQQPGGNEELDFDDLAKRFDMLKKKGAK